jgi:serine/threonine protein phosphatase PrpC
MEDGHQIFDPLPVSKCIEGQIGGRHPDEHWSFFAVYDGHGGRQAVDWLEAHFHTVVASELQTLSILETGHHDHSAVVASLTRAFQKIDTQLATLGAWKYGSTATVALVHTSFAGKTLYVANVGDSRAVLVGGPCVHQLSTDHRATDPAEVARVQSEGGLVFRKRVGGVLSVSRALGDHQLKGECGGVSCVPDVSVTEVHGAKALVMASDGLWDVLNAASVQNILQNCIQSGIESRSIPEQLRDRLSNSAAQALVEAAMQEGSRDNILALVAFL